MSSTTGTDMFNKIFCMQDYKVNKNYSFIGVTFRELLF